MWRIMKTTISGHQNFSLLEKSVNSLVFSFKFHQRKNEFEKYMYL